MEVRDVLMTCIITANEAIYFGMEKITAVFVFALSLIPHTVPYISALFPGDTVGTSLNPR